MRASAVFAPAAGHPGQRMESKRSRKTRGLGSVPGRVVSKTPMWKTFFNFFSGSDIFPLLARPGAGRLGRVAEIPALQQDPELRGVDPQRLAFKPGPCECPGLHAFQDEAESDPVPEEKLQFIVMLVAEAEDRRLEWARKHPGLDDVGESVDAQPQIDGSGAKTSRLGK